MSKELFTRFSLLKDHYKNNLSKWNMKYFQVMHELYTKLLELNNQRMGIAVDAMIAAGLSEKEIRAIGQV